MCEHCTRELERLGIISVSWATPDGLAPLEKMRRLGREFGYPACCVDAFVADIAIDCHPGLLRGSMPVPGRPDATYVPCDECRVQRQGVAA